MKSQVRDEVKFSYEERFGRYRVAAAFSIARIDADALLFVTIRVRLQADRRRIKPSRLMERSREWADAVARKWSGRAVLSCPSAKDLPSEYDVAIRIEFVDAGEHHVVRVVPDVRRAHEDLWSISMSGDVVAHEVGHMVGLADEYPTEGFPESATHGIMYRETDDVEPKDYRVLAEWLNSATGRAYSPKPMEGEPPAYLLDHTWFPPADRRSREVEVRGRAAGSGSAFGYQAGQRVHEFELLEPLGAGGFAEVWKARHSDLPALGVVAVKIYRTPSDLPFVRFEGKAQMTDHPGIVRVLEVRTASPPPILVLEWFDSESLRTLLRKRSKIPPSEVIEIFRQVVSAVAHAHDHGVVHGDIKPENILVDRNGLCKVTDFGLGLDAAGEDQPIAPSGTVKIRGTPDYISPEQRSGACPSKRSDVFQLGVLLFEMVTGAPYPLNADELAKAGVDEDLVNLASSCVKREPQDRPADANKVLEGLVGDDDGGEDQNPVQNDSPLSCSEAEASEPGRSTALRLVAAFLGIVLVSFVAWGSWRHAVSAHEPVPLSDGENAFMRNTYEIEAYEEAEAQQVLNAANAGQRGVILRLRLRKSRDGERRDLSIKVSDYGAREILKKLAQDQEDGRIDTGVHMKHGAMPDALGIFDGHDVVFLVPYKSKSERKPVAH